MESMSISFIWPSSMVNLLYRLFGTPPSGASGGRKSGDYLPPRQGPPETPPGAAPLDPAFKKPLLVSPPDPGGRTASPCYLSPRQGSPCSTVTSIRTLAVGAREVAPCSGRPPLAFCVVN